MLEDGFFDPLKPMWIRWGNLPHWRQDGALYFVTFRLSDSLPQVRLKQLQRERTEWRDARTYLDNEALLEKSLLHRRRIEKWLDEGSGSCVLRDSVAKEIVESAVRHFDGVRYEIGPFTVAPNHVHVLVRPASSVDLSKILYSWKRFSSGRLRKTEPIARAFAGRSHLWQTESFDHIVRNSRELDRIKAYIARHEH
ncbi:MAG TPA: transposase [Thermoanaerobaculia bacterium]|nr:transposase [Thermoanaerobaculia bacterium]